MTWMIHFAPNIVAEFGEQICTRFEKIFRDMFDEDIKMEVRLLELVDDNKLLKAAIDNHVKVIFCGHSHHHRNYSFGENGELKITCAGTALLEQPEKKEYATIHLKKITLSNESYKLEQTDFFWDEGHFAPLPN